MIIAVFIIQPISLPSCNWVVGVTEWINALVHGGGGGVSRDFDYNPGISVNLSRDRPFRLASMHKYCGHIDSHTSATHYGLHNIHILQMASLYQN